MRGRPLNCVWLPSPTGLATPHANEKREICLEKAAAARPPVQEQDHRPESRHLRVCATAATHSHVFHLVAPLLLLVHAPVECSLPGPSLILAIGDTSQPPLVHASRRHTFHHALNSFTYSRRNTEHIYSHGTYLVGWEDGLDRMAGAPAGTAPAGIALEMAREMPNKRICQVISPQRRARRRLAGS